MGSYVSFMPDQLIEEWKDDDYIACLRFLSTSWNFNVMTANKWACDLKELGLPLGFAERAQMWAYFYFGNANNTAYNHILLKEDGTRKTLKMFSGKDIMKFVNYSIEQYIEFAARIPEILSVKDISEDVVSKRKFDQNLFKFLNDQRIGSQFANPQNAPYLDTVSGKRFANNVGENISSEDFNEGMSKAGINCAKDAYYRNHLDEGFVDVGKFATITGAAMIHQEICNGHSKVECVPIWEAIFPPNATGDQHRKDAYGGRIQFMTVQEVMANFPELQSKKKEIKALAETSDAINNWVAYNTTYGNANFNWWNVIDGIPRIAVVRGQWASYRKEDADEYRQCNREGTLVGNKYLIRNKISNNQTKDWTNPSEPNLDWQIVQPMNVFGRNMGIPEMLYTYQNQMDGWQTKINEWIAQTKGTFYVVATEDLGMMSPEEFATQISGNRIVFMKRTQMDAGKMGELTSQGAIEMPRDTILLFQQIKEFRAMMSDILNTPDAVRGQLSGYQGQKTLNAQLAQAAKGTRYFSDPIQKFYRRVLQKSVDMFKTSTLDNIGGDYSLIIGDSEMETFKATRQFGLSNQALYLGFEDLADDGYKQAMMQTILAYAQNSQGTGYMLSDFSRIAGMNNRKDIENYLEYREKQITDKMDAEKLAVRKDAMVQSQNANAAQTEMEAARQIGADKRQNKELVSKETIEAAKIESKEDIHTASLIDESLSRQQEQENMALEAKLNPPQPAQ